MSLEIIELDDFDLSLLDKLIALQGEAFGKLGLNESTLPTLIRYGRVFLLRTDKEIIGSAEFMRDWNNRDLIFLVGFSIKKSQRQKGMGKAFLGGALDRLGSRASRIRLTVSPQNLAALGLYRHFGFKEIGFYEDEYGAGEDRLLLELQLAEQKWAK